MMKNLLRAKSQNDETMKMEALQVETVYN